MSGVPVVLAVPGCEPAAEQLRARLGGEEGARRIHRFPDGEVLIRIDTPVAGREVILVGSLDHPADKLLPLYFLASTARDLGAARVGLVAPYLAFMRQDSRFHQGEGVTSVYFARLLSSTVDWLVTVDPHLHRWASLDDVYAIPSRIARAAPAIAGWVRAEVARPLLVGPDAESEQWVAAVAEACDAPFIILEKTRRGDRDVSVSDPDVAAHAGRTPVLVDDIISTGRTMVETLHQLTRAGMRDAVCVGVHGLFADDALDELRAAGATRIVTCNTVPHDSNAICVWDAIAEATGGLLT
ncbi:MAG: ribose-phosphate pyrophosphokinase [Kofleriaceae bacterium]|nr:ribose-phosphate pyrophosphokinase [Myxococcales bacterium]MCB9560661.1 ribose-phosphate pyrophosphokinase [Kofleriaceae bacterium]MCB9575169.1 ribose-phosphate pyrophosphokinase [Kofleriaceae bacterium]